ncbi:hypothetical protein GCM10010470_02440 [Saccharopolyspora taberi]|uniref:P27 family phage terminase small subunit n=1 Tax=Saccharopolyspora taberi TaxID=60895 RepID=A0ABN3V0Z0_9PSEU
MDFVAMVKQTIRTPGSALNRVAAGGWGWHEENTARLYEALNYWLELAWIDRTTDPDDPEVKRERAEAKRAGIKPPPHPLIPPVALRPSEIADERFQAYLDEVGQYQTKRQEQQGGKRQVTSDEFDRIMGL